MGSDLDFHAAWVSALDELEIDVGKAEDLLRASADVIPEPVSPWTPPALSAPLPVDLRERAQALLDRQLRTAHALSMATLATGRQLGVAARVQDGRDGGRAVFVDQLA